MKSRKPSPIEIDKAEFKEIGYQLIDTLAAFFDEIGKHPVTKGESPATLQKALGKNSLPHKAKRPEKVMNRAAKLVLKHSLYNGHPKFMGYITSSAAPIGALADLLAAGVNPNVGAQILSPIATEIEKQTIGWLAELIGVGSSWSGLLVSGGNMANFTGFLAGRTAKAPKTIKQQGISMNQSKLLVYCSKTTHTWIEKAVVLFGLGLDAIRWIPATSQQKMDLAVLQDAIAEDLKNGLHPMMVIGTAGDVSTGSVDNLQQIGAICRKYSLWFHIDGAYGIPAAIIPELKSVFKGIETADSIALDPHKWLYSPLEAGCTLVKDRNHLIETFSSHPVYYNFDQDQGGEMQNYYEYGLQNSRGFRALKVWCGLQQVGKQGYIKMIRKNIRLAELFFKLARNHKELEAVTCHLSITTLRFVPAGLKLTAGEKEKYLNELNEKLLNILQKEGEVFLSNAVVDEKYCLRSCIVNFRTSRKDIEEIIEIIVGAGKALHKKMLRKV